MKERIYYLDYAKAIGIIMIIMAHTFMWTSTTHLVCDIVCSVHVPIFFVISGLLLSIFPRQDNFGEFVRKRAKALLVPYIWFSIYNMLLTWSILFVTQKMDTTRLKDELVELFITGNGTVWFLVTLFIAEVIFLIVYKTQKHKDSILIISAIIGECIAFGFNDIIANPVWTVIARAFSAYGFVVFGYYLKSITELNNRRKQLLAIVCFCIWLLLFIYARYSFEFFEGRFEKPWTSIPTILSGSTCIILLLSCIKKKLAMMEYVGKNSLLYMLCHPTFIKMYIFAGIAFVQAQSPSMQIFLSIGVLFVVILGSTVFGEFVTRYIPFVIGKDKKK